MHRLAAPVYPSTQVPEQGSGQANGNDSGTAAGSVTVERNGATLTVTLPPAGNQN
jgi:hypothetical protein